MSDSFLMQDDFVENIKTKKNRKIEKFVDSLIYTNTTEKDSKNEIVIVVDDYILKEEAFQFYKYYIEESLGTKKVSFVYGLTVLTDQKKLVSNIGQLYIDYATDLSKYITKGYTVVMTFGRNLYGATNGNTDLSPRDFYAFLFTNTYFYSPYYKTYVFPVDAYSETVLKDSFKEFFLRKQFENINKFLKNSDGSFIKRLPIPKTKIIESKEEANAFFKQYIRTRSIKKIGLDLETSGFNFLDDRILCVSIALNTSDGYLIRWKDVDIDLFNEFIQDKKQVWNNGKFDVKFLWQNGVIDARVDEDNMNLGQIVNEMRSHSLKSQSFYYTMFGGYDDALDDYKKRYPGLKSYADIPEDILFPYAILDAVNTYIVNEELHKYIVRNEKKFFTEKDKYKLSNYYYDFVIPSLNMYIDVEYRGINVAWDVLESKYYDLHKRIIDQKNKIVLALGINDNIELSYDDEFTEEETDILSNCDFADIVNSKNSVNVNSNEQLGKLLMEKNWEKVELTKKGFYKVNAKTLNFWSKKGYKEAEMIVELHELETLMKTFVGNKKEGTGFWQYRYSDNKLHPTFAVMMADSGRCKCTNPNCQNIPSRGWKAELVRSYFSTPSEDYVFMSADYSGLQLRLSAMVNNDEVFRDVFISKGGDLHSMTAASVIMNNRVSFEEFVQRKKETEFLFARLKAKGFNFSILFGALAYTIKTNCIEKEWTDKEVDDYINDYKLDMLLDKKTGWPDKKLTVADKLRSNFFTTYCGLFSYLESEKGKAKKLGYVKSPYGAIRQLPQLLYFGTNDTIKDLNNLLSIALNSPIQNMESCVIQRATYKLWKWLKDTNKKSYLFDTVHDAIELYVYKPEYQEVKSKIIEFFTVNYEEYNGIPLEIEGNVSDYFGKNELWDMGKKWNDVSYN